MNHCIEVGSHQPGMPAYALQSSDNKKIKIHLEALKIKCEKIVNGSFFDSSLGTLDQLRVELETKFASKRFSVPVMGAKLDCMILLPIVENETASSKMLRIRALEHILEDRDGNTSRDNSLKNSRLDLKLNDSVTHLDTCKMVMFCQPNGQHYEFFAVDPTLVSHFLKRGTYVFLWNYRGYGRSSGRPCLQVLFLIIRIVSMMDIKLSISFD